MKLSDVLLICFTNIILIASSSYVPVVHVHSYNHSSVFLLAGFLAFFLLSLRKRKPVTATTSTTTVPPKSCSVGYTSYPGPGKSFCYRIASDCKTRDEARTACQKEGADLTSLDKASLKPFSEVLRQQFRGNQTCDHDDSLWLGEATNDTPLAMYIDGQSIPSNSPLWQIDNPSAPVFCIFYSTKPAGTILRDIKCNSKLQYVCQQM